MVGEKIILCFFEHLDEKSKFSSDKDFVTKPKFYQCSPTNISKISYKKPGSCRNTLNLIKNKAHFENTSNLLHICLISLCVIGCRKTILTTNLVPQVTAF